VRHDAINAPGVRVKGGPLDGNVYEFPAREIGETIELNTAAGPRVHKFVRTKDGTTILEYVGPAALNEVVDATDGSEF
jgi:hypothetical protein